MPPQSERIPPAFLLFGAAGLLPPLALLLLILRTPDGLAVPVIYAVVLAYAALILSFIGGTWWGFAAARSERGGAGILAVAVSPSLLALALLAVAVRFPQGGGYALGAAIAASPLLDMLMQRSDLAPGWWLRLRIPLSLALGALTAIAAALIG